MREIIFDLVTAIGILCGVVLLVDAFPIALASLRRRRRSRGGAFGVVVDRGGRVLGTYLDPFGHPWRAPRVLEPDSPWTASAAGGQGWAWEGFGATEEEAHLAANRMRRRHLLMLPWMGGDEDEPEDFLTGPSTHQPPWS